MTNDKTIIGVAADAVNKNRKYKHSVDKSIETKNKKKTVKRETVYKSTPASLKDTQDREEAIRLIKDKLETLRSSIENKEVATITDIDVKLKSIVYYIDTLPFM
ncbi:hypothetical protein [Dipodfec virus UOA04_Rod_841]|nr:hypothetical protein [Dipodfec virus UOA04_Rod_841]